MDKSKDEHTPFVDFDVISPTLAVRKYIEHYPAPYHGLILDVDRAPDPLGIINIYTYADNTHSFSDPQRQELWLWLKGMLEWLNSVSNRHAWQTEERESTP